MRRDVVSEGELSEVGFDDFARSSKTDGGVPGREGAEDQLLSGRDAFDRDGRLTSRAFAFLGTHCLEADHSWCRRRFQY